MTTTGGFGSRNARGIGLRAGCFHRLFSGSAATALFLAGFFAGPARAQIHLPPPTDTSFSGTISSAAGVNLIDPVLIYNNYLFNTLEGSWAIPANITAVLGGYAIQTATVALPTFGTSTVELVGQYTDASCSSDCGVVISVDPNSLLAAAGSIATGGAVLAPGDPFNSVVNPSGTATPIDETDFSDEIGQLAAAGAIATGGAAFTTTYPELVAFAQEDTGAFSDTSQGGSISGDEIWSFSGADDIGTLDLTQGPSPASAAPEPALWMPLAVWLAALAIFRRTRVGKGARPTPGKSRAHCAG